MAQSTDLYPILKAYANKNNSPYIDIDLFLTFLEKYAVRKAQEQPEWAKWTSDKSVKFWGEMSPLVESNKCILMSDTLDGRIYMPFFYRDMLRDYYQNPDNLAYLPFPDEETLGITIPEAQIKRIHLASDMGVFFEKKQDPAEDDADEDSKEAMNSPYGIVRLAFPDNYGAALLLRPMIPRQLMEAALLKVRHHLRGHSNKEYTLQKLKPQLQGREKYLREILDQAMIRPMDCLTALENFGDFPYLFWTYFCSLIKNDIKKKKEVLSEDLAVIQAAYIIEVCSGFYKALAVKKREREIAIRSLELHMEKPPFYFTIDDIIKFANDKGVSLLSLYSQRDLDEFIKTKTTESKDKGLPEWLILQGKKGQFWYIKKEKFLPLCAKMLIDTRPLIKTAITKRWMKLLKQFHRETAMEKDPEFDRLLAAYTAAIQPILTALLKDTKLLWVYEELERTQKAIPPSSRIFKSGKLIPMSALYVVRRKDLLTDAKILLPFWYSIPVISSFLAFLKGLGKKKKKQAEANIEVEEEVETEGKDDKEIQSTAKAIEARLVPHGQSLDAYLGELETRWGRLLDKQARQNLITDVQSLVRDNLRQSIRVHKTKKISHEGLSEMTAHLISRTPALQSLGSQDSLSLYMELYMVKLLINFKM